MIYHREIEARRRTQRHNLFVLAFLFVVASIAIVFFTPDPIEVQSGPGYEVCKEAGC